MGALYVVGVDPSNGTDYATKAVFRVNEDRTMTLVAIHQEKPMSPDCPNCCAPVSRCNCNHQAAMAQDECENRDPVRRSASGEAHDAIERMRAVQAELGHQLDCAHEEIHALRVELEKVHRQFRVAEDFAIQISRRLNTTRQ